MNVHTTGHETRASLATIIESLCEQFRVVYIGPVNFNDRDQEITRAELGGQITAQTLVNIITEMESTVTGEIKVCRDNKDSLVMQHINTTKTSFRRFFRPNVYL